MEIEEVSQEWMDTTKSLLEGEIKRLKRIQAEYDYAKERLDTQTEKVNGMKQFLNFCHVRH